jgi:glutathione S-transferase
MDLDYELQLVDRKSNSQKSTEYLKLNPAGRIPTLIDNSLVLFESPAICIYLCEQHPEKKLIPAVGNIDRPKFFQWLTFLNNTLQSELMIYCYPHNHTTNKKCVDSIIKAQEERIAEVLLIIDNQLIGKNYLLGNDISACDFFLFMLSEWSLNIEKSPLSFSNLGSYLRKLAQHSTIREVCKKENISLNPFE